jgi:universal stress protein A
MQRFRRILCPIDFSPPSQAALDAALEMARQYDATLTLLHVHQPAAVVPDGVVIMPPAALQGMFDAGDKLLARWREVAEGHGVKTSTTTRLGGPADEILRVARDEQHDLIVIGTHGRTGLKHVILGSVAERVVRGASCPVLTVRGENAQTLRPALEERIDFADGTR